MGLAFALVGCGGSGGGGGEGEAGGADGAGEDGGEGAPDDWPESLPSVALTEASALSVGEAEAAAASGCLAQAQAGLTGDAVAAGRTAAAGVEAIWVAYEGAGAPRAAVQVCDEGTCACATAEFTSNGATVTAVEGELPVVGAPVLSKVLTAAGLDSDTELATKEGGLEAPPNNLDAGLFAGRRRFLVANAYGPLFGIDFAPLVEIVDESGLFSDAREHRYVQATHMDSYLNEMHALDVLVWFGAAVQRGVGAPKPEGMIVNRGLLGDQTYDRERIEAQLEPAPLGGPGLIVFAGSETFGTAEGGLPTGGVAQLISSTEVRPRAIVGFKGWVEPREAMRSTRVLVRELVGNETLAVALDAANEELAALGSSATMVANLTAEASGRWRLARAFSSYWGDDVPTAAQFVLNFLPGSSTQCTAPGEAPYQPNNIRVQFFADVSFDGPFFSGSKISDQQNFEVFGVVGDLAQGGDVRFFLQGSSDYMGDVTILGDGHFCASGECAGKVAPPVAFGAAGEKLYLSGTAVASPYTVLGGKDDGDTCSIFDSKLTGTGDDPGWILFNQP